MELTSCTVEINRQYAHSKRNNRLEPLSHKYFIVDNVRSEKEYVKP